MATLVQAYAGGPSSKIFSWRLAACLDDGDDCFDIRAAFKRAAVVDKLLFLINEASAGLLVSLHAVPGAQLLIAVLVLSRGLLKVCSTQMCISYWQCKYCQRVAE